MFRLIVALAFAFIGSQFPAYYFAYIQQMEADARVLAQGTGPQWQVDALRSQVTELMYAEPVEWPFRFIDAFDGDRATATLERLWEPRMPEGGIEWAYGAAGLVLGFLVTGILGSLFGRGRAVRTARQPAGTSARTAHRPATTAARTAQRPAAASSSPWAHAAGTAGTAAMPQQATSTGTTASRIPASSSGVRETSRLARDALRQARQAMSTARNELGVAGVVTNPANQPVPMSVQRSGIGGAVIPSRYRPPAITRRFESRYAGPIERVTHFRD